MNSADSKRHDGMDEPGSVHAVRVNGEAALARIGEALRGLRYGAVLAIVQDGVVIQIERTEKIRLDKPPSAEHRGR